MDCGLLTLDDGERWIRCLSRIPCAKRDVYFTPSYCRAAAAPAAEICAWFYEDGGNTALYPFMLNPLPPPGLSADVDGYCDIEGFYGYTGMIASVDDPEFIAGFYRSFDTFCRDRRVVVEFTRFHPLLNNENFSAGRMETKHVQNTVAIDLRPGYESVWRDSYDSKNRNMVRKAQKNGVVCRLGSDWDEFQRLYRITMDNCGASSDYYFEPRYFDDLRKIAGAEGECLLLEAVWENRIIASMILMLHGDYAHYHLSARNPEFSRLAANNVLLDYAVRTACERGAAFMHLGGGKSGNDTLLHFKAGFSPELHPFHIGWKIYEPEIYRRLCTAWENANPDKVDTYRNYCLKYRY